MNLTYPFLTLILFLFLTPFSGNAFGSAVPSEAESKHGDTLVNTFTPPCQVITLEVINKVFEIADIEIALDGSKKTFPTCKYTWKGDNKKTMDLGSTKMDVDIESEVMIVMVDMAVSKKQYDASIKSYTDELEELPVGDYAVWSNKRRQMTVLIGKQLFHVHVDINPDNAFNQEKAIALSEIIVESF